jgi:hypothetical protein
MLEQNVDSHGYPEGALIDPKFVAPGKRTNKVRTGPAGTEEVDHTPFRAPGSDKRPPATSRVRG